MRIGIRFARFRKNSRPDACSETDAQNQHELAVARGGPATIWPRQRGDPRGVNANVFDMSCF
jgi:hypothetical protein